MKASELTAFTHMASLFQVQIILEGIFEIMFLDISEYKLFSGFIFLNTKDYKTTISKTFYAM